MQILPLCTVKKIKGGKIDIKKERKKDIKEKVKKISKKTIDQ